MSRTHANDQVGDRRKVYVLGQPFWLANVDNVALRWSMAGSEHEPTDNDAKEESAFRLDPAAHAEDTVNAVKWRRVDADPIKAREALLRFATSGDEAWRRVGLVCGAGIGKSCTLEWLTWAINGRDHSRGKHLAFCLPLERTPLESNALFDHLLKRMHSEPAAPSLGATLRRMCQAGRITLLFDSLDQAGPDPKGKVVQALNELFSGSWGGCRMWISGRPYAFRRARSEFLDKHANTPWQFVRVGQLDVPERRFLIETALRPTYP